MSVQHDKQPQEGVVRVDPEHQYVAASLATRSRSRWAAHQAEKVQPRAWTRLAPCLSMDHAVDARVVMQEELVAVA